MRPSFVRQVTTTVAIVVTAVVALYLVYLLRTPIGWLVLAGFIALAVSGPVELLSRRMRRGFAIALVYLGVILTPVLVLAVLLPPIVEQATNLAAEAPRYAADASRFVAENKRLQDLDRQYGVTDQVVEQARSLPSKLSGAAGSLASIGAGIVSSLFALVTILLLSVFMIGGAPRWRRGLTRWQPEDRANAIDRLVERIGDAVGGYVRGALLQALIAGVTSFIVLVVLGVPYPAALALVIFLLDLLPLIGATVGALVVGVVTLFANFPIATIVWVIWSIIYQQVENNVIQPRIQSRALAIDPFIVIVAVLFGSALFGVFGALLAIPGAAAIQIAVREYVRFRRGGDLEEIEDTPPPPVTATMPA